MTKIEEMKIAKRRRAKVLAQRKKGWTLARIAEAHGVTTARISAMLKKAREDLRGPA